MIHFMKYKFIYFLISSLVLIPGIYSLVVWGLKPSIDFTGGSLLEVKMLPSVENAPSIEVLMSNMSTDNVFLSSFQRVGNTDSYIIKTNWINENTKNIVIQNLSKYYDVNILRFESVGPTLGRELLIRTGVAALLASLVILAYVAYQFKDLVFGISAILAMFHDTLVLLGVFSLLGHFLGVEVDMLFVTALLTTLSFSVHDTIVVFDRVRESKKLSKSSSVDDLIDTSIMGTMSRSLNNSMTIIFMLTALVVLGGDSIRWFVVALLVGTVSGTYSSTFTAAPLLSILHKRFAS